MGVARGLAADPPVILMDEPFGAVDPITRQRLQDELLSIQRELRKTIVCVTHDIDEAIKLGDRILILREGAQDRAVRHPGGDPGQPGRRLRGRLRGRRLVAQAAEPGPHLRAGAAHPDHRHHRRGGLGGARAGPESNGDTAVVVLDDRNRPRGWPWLRQLKGESIVEPTEDLVSLDHRATLNDALDTMLTNSHGGAVVTGDRDQYLGVVDFVAVTDHMRAMQEKASADAEKQRRGAGGPDASQRVTAVGEQTASVPSRTGTAG